MPERIIHARSDFMFKKLFGDKNDQTNLRLLLRAILSDMPKEEFENINFKQTILPPDIKEGKTCILDFLAVTHSGYEVHIEMQVVGSLILVKRMVYYNAKLVVNQLSSGDDYPNLKRSVSIFILDFPLIDDDQYFHSFRFYDKKSGKELTDLTEMITIELEKVKEETDGTDIWPWAKLFKADTGEELGMLEANPELSHAVETIRHFSKDKEAWLQFEAEEKARADYRVHMAESRAKGMAEGEAKGMAEGEAKGRVETARNLFNLGLPIELIAQATKLSLEELENLKGS
jgi:predicted transposase/invertase (TIGR01784 family)